MSSHERGPRQGAYTWLVGPDGSGKSTLITSLSEMGALTRYWRPGVLPMPRQLAGRGLPEGINSDPHARRPDPSWKAWLRGLYYLADYGIGYLLVIRPSIKAGRDYVLDRAWADMCVDPRRYGFSSDLIPNVLLRFIRKPDVLALVAVPPDVAHARKPELPVEEIADQYARWVTFSLRHDIDLVYVDNSGAPGDAIDALRAHLEGIAK